MDLLANPYFLARDDSGQVWRVARDAQSKVATDGVALALDQLFLFQTGADPTIYEFSGVQAWFDSVPTVVA